MHPKTPERTAAIPAYLQRLVDEGSTEKANTKDAHFHPRRNYRKHVRLSLCDRSGRQLTESLINLQSSKAPHAKSAKGGIFQYLLTRLSKIKLEANLGDDLQLNISGET